MSIQLLAIPLALLLSVSLTPGVRAIACRRKLVANPQADRWHKRPTALFGGVAICLSVVLSWAVFGPYGGGTLAVLAGGGFLFLVGLIDDVRQFKPYQKLVAQVVAAAIVLFSGLLLPWTPWTAVNMGLTLLWLVGLTNAINLLDNMDGLAAGIAAIAAGFLSFNLFQNGQMAEAIMAAALVAALIGFLVYNWHPASIFMGDCGSMFVGFVLAGTALLSLGGGRSQSILSVMAGPVLILLIPILDTTLVTLVRKLSGRAASQGGRDHVSHRLVALGMSERRAVLMLYGLAVAGGLLAVGISHLALDIAVTILVGFALAVTLLAIYLGRVAIYDPDEVAAAQGRPVIALLVNLTYKRRLFEVLLDVVLIVLSYCTAYSLVFGSIVQNGGDRLLLQIVPILIGVKLPLLLILGVYRGLWRYVGIHDLVVYAKAVLASSCLVAIVLLLVFRFEGYSRVVLVLDGLTLFAYLAGSRLAFRLLRSLLSQSPPSAGKRRALIYGAGDSGELLLRELRNSKESDFDPIGFVDDDPIKEGMTLHGLRVFAGNGSLRRVIHECRADSVIISSTKFTTERVAEIKGNCSEANVILNRLRIAIEKIH